MNELRIFLIGQKGFAEQVARSVRRYLVGGAAPPDEADRLRRYLTAEGLEPLDWRQMDVSSLPGDLDLILAVHAHIHIGQSVRARARYGALGYHPSLLPLHRGRDSIRWAIEHRDRITGGTVYQMDDGYDTGPVAAQDWCFVRQGDDAAALWRRELAPMGLRLLRGVVDRLAASGEMELKAQDDALATSEPPWFRRELGDGEHCGREPVFG